MARRRDPILAAVLGVPARRPHGYEPEEVPPELPQLRSISRVEKDGPTFLIGVSLIVGLSVLAGMAVKGLMNVKIPNISIQITVEGDRDEYRPPPPTPTTKSDPPALAAKSASH
jgi:hypothetical protein